MIFRKSYNDSFLDVSNAMRALAQAPRSVNVTHGPININTTVTEKRAATDESVRILNEMQKAAIESLVAKWEPSDNIFNCKAAMFMRAEHMDNVIVVVYRYNSIHDRRVEYAFNPEDIKFGRKTIQQVIEGLHQAIVNDLAKVITQCTLTAVGEQILQQKYGT